MSLYELIASLLTLSAVFAWINARYIRLPVNIAMLILGLVASLCLIGLDFLIPDTDLYDALAEAIGQIDFYDAVMNGMLAFLLFAGAMHVDLSLLRERAPVIASLATMGVVLSAAIVAVGLWAVANGLGYQLSFAWALVFGTLIAPTDPVAVLATLKTVKVPAAMETDIKAESLFNDGVAVVLFAIAVQLASSDGEMTVLHAGELLVVEAGGGALLGLVAGYIAYRAMHTVDDYGVEILLTLALVTGTYTLASALHMSGPIAVVIAGLLIGNHGADYAMSDTTRRYLFDFWTLIDDLLNALLFLLIGLEVLILSFDPGLAGLGLLMIPLVLGARFVAVGLSTLLLKAWQDFVRGTTVVMTWGGIRGGISIALVLSLTDGEARTLLLTATYAVVLFSIIVQGLSLGTVIRKMVKPVADADMEAKAAGKAH